VIDKDILSEARRLMAAANSSDVLVRTIGGTAVALHAPGGVPPALARPYRDIDLVTTKKGGPATLELLIGMGYEPNTRFNSLNSASRLVVYDNVNGRQIDVFVGSFRMCHAIPITDRLALDPQTIPLAELLLTKLQIAKLNAKDVKDILAIVVEHEVGDHDDDTINAEYIAGLLSGDWGLWRTTKGTIETVRAQLPDSGLDPAQQHQVDERLVALWDRIEARPKSMRWRARARVGDKARWYDEPEEIEHADIGQSAGVSA
jgi:hypothetical protein